MFGMVTRRIKKLIAWGIAVGVVVLLALGVIALAGMV